MPLQVKLRIKYHYIILCTALSSHVDLPVFNYKQNTTRKFSLRQKIFSNIHNQIFVCCWKYFSVKLSVNLSNSDIILKGILILVLLCICVTSGGVDCVESQFIDKGGLQIVYQLINLSAELLN